MRLATLGYVILSWRGRAVHSVPKNLTCDLRASSQVKGLRDREGARKREGRERIVGWGRYGRDEEGTR